MMNLKVYENEIGNHILQIEKYNKTEFLKWTYEDSKQYIIYDYTYKVRIYELIACIRCLLNQKE